MRKRYRPVQLGPTETLVEHDSEGRYLLRSASTLRPHPPRLTQRLVHWAERAPERAFLAKRGPDGAWRALSYGEALDRVGRIAAALCGRGLSVERPLMILSENDLEHALLALAAQHVGVPFVPVSPAYSLLSRDHARLREVVARLTPGLVFAADARRFARALAAAVPATTEVVCAQHAHTLDRPCTPYAALEQRSATSVVEEAHHAVGPDTIAKFLLTSGSTGSPKATIQTMQMLTSNQQMIAQCLPFLSETPPVIVDWLPWHHTFGGNHNLGLTLYHGGTLYIDEGRPTPDAFGESLRNLREVAPTVYFNVPRGFDELARALERDHELARVFFSRVRLLFYAAAGISQRTWDTLEQLAERVTGERIVMITGLGMTETAPWALSAHWLEGRSGVVGVPAPGLEVRLAPVGHKLEARYRGPSVTPGFWRAPELTAAAFDEDGFYRSGDAVKFIDAAVPGRGLVFDGRLAEDFKLDTGTWVSVGPLRLHVLREGAPYVQDIVPTAPDRSELGMLIVPNVAACRDLCRDVPAASAPSEVLAHPATRACFQALLDKLAASATGSSTCITRALVITEPLSLDDGEITDKGTVVQAQVRHTRSDLVNKLYAEDPDVLRITRP